MENRPQGPSKVKVIIFQFIFVLFIFEWGVSKTTYDTYGNDTETYEISRPVNLWEDADEVALDGSHAFNM